VKSSGLILYFVLGGKKTKSN